MSNRSISESYVHIAFMTNGPFLFTKDDPQPKKTSRGL
jgi:hypothetical protein